MKLTPASTVLALFRLATALVRETGALWGKPPPHLPVRRPLLESDALQELIHSESLLRHAKKLVRFSEMSNGTRVFGSKGHNATVDYIKELLDRTGYYDTYLQTFPYLYPESTAQFSTQNQKYLTRGFSYSPAGEVAAPVFPVDALGCELANFPPAVAGKIALIKRGDCDFGLKVAHAGAAGALAVIICNNADGELSGSGGTLRIPRLEGPYVPVGSISGLSGDALVKTIAAGTEVIGILHTQSLNEERYSSNVIATTKQGDKDNIIFAGAHADSVAAGPGINDDGSGTIAILEIALRLPKFSVKNAVRFGFWTAEEFGLIGSTYHVQKLTHEERQKIALYLNFDMLAWSGFLSVVS